jgi:ribosomal protein S17
LRNFKSDVHKPDDANSLVGERTGIISTKTLSALRYFAVIGAVKAVG